MLKTISHGLSKNISHWENIKKAPVDPIIGLTEQFMKDHNTNKINLSIGVYKQDNGKPLVLNSVKKAKELIKNENHEYAGIAGLNNYIHKSLQFAYGNNINLNKLAAVQTISGTGACRIGAEFISKNFNNKDIYLPNPTWANHIPIMKNAGLNVKKYSYYNPNTISIDFNNMKKDINMAPNNSIFLFHACAHNPTGIDPNKEKWDEILDIIKIKNHITFFDCAYQGFASGDHNQDAYPIRKFYEENQPIILAQSFSKNFGLYGERVGTLSITTNNEEEKDNILSNLKSIIRPMYSNPPINGAKIVTTILENEDLYNEWCIECKEMSNRIQNMRKLLQSKLETLDYYKNWNHITEQIGMFCYSGLKPNEIKTLKDKYHIYITSDGRINMAGVNNSNIDYLANSISKVT